MSNSGIDARRNIVELMFAILLNSIIMSCYYWEPIDIVDWVLVNFITKAHERCRKSLLVLQ